MIGNYEKSGNEDREPQQQPQSAAAQSNRTNGVNRTRVVEIPVQHYTTPVISSSSLPSSNASPTASNSAGISNPSFQNSQQFFNSQQQPESLIDTNEFFNRPSIFDEFQSPFDIFDRPLRSRTLFNNREQPFGSNIDEFFRPHPLIQKNRFFNRSSNSPGRDIFYQQQPQPQAQPQQPQAQQQQQFPSGGQYNQNRSNSSSDLLDSNSNEINGANNLNNLNNNNNTTSSNQSPTDSRNQSPKRFTSQATLFTTGQPIVQQPVQPVQQQQQPQPQPSQPQQYQETQQATSATGIPIPIKHISTSPLRSDPTYIGSDFKHKIPTPVEVKSGSPSRQSTPPTSKVNVEYYQQAAPSYSQPQTQPQPQQQQQPQPSSSQEVPNMGNSFQGQGSSGKRSNTSVPPDFSDFKHPHPQQQQANAASPQTNFNSNNNNNNSNIIKIAQDKCNEIANQLEKYEKDVNQFNGRKNDKQFLVLDEYLTRCLLKLDEIDRSDEKINQMRRRLINYTHQLSERLESRATGQQQQQQQSNDENNSNNTSSSSGNGDNNVPPSSKRAKSPSSENTNDSNTIQNTTTTTATTTSAQNQNQEEASSLNSFASSSNNNNNNTSPNNDSNQSQTTTTITNTDNSNEPSQN